MDPHPFVTARAIPITRAAPRRADLRGPLALVVVALLAAVVAGGVTRPAATGHIARTA